MEALESFREATTAATQISDMNSPESNASNEPHTQYYQSTSFPIIPRHPYGLQNRSNPSTPISASSRAPSEFTSAPVTPSLAPSLDINMGSKPHLDQNGHGMWDLNQAVDVGLIIEDIEGSQNAQYPNTAEVGSSNLVKGVRAAENSCYNPLLLWHIAASWYCVLTYKCFSTHGIDIWITRFRMAKPIFI